ncbi:MAG TPA: Gfo/Idh/MocA family oxidoreductase [Candidatus Polarisedimenticolia bacterium]|jgi:predicted dehydrogenase|nr:Gfo/Idh/MocA family oxidoreductase [Candidatus Polarisedimenticolia bacterium]
MRKDSHRSARSNPGGRVRYAVVGLGYIAQVAVLPAFANARRNSEICALFSGDPAKRRTLGRTYGVEPFPRTDQFAPKVLHFPTAS